MNFGSIVTLLPYLTKIFSLLPVLEKVVARGFSINAIEQDIDDPDLRAFLAGIAKQLFPSVKPELQIAAGAATVAKDRVMKVQGLLNQVVSPSPGLDVDGDYGPLTKAAVLAYQKAKGLVADEFAGDATMAALIADAVKTVPAALGGAGAQANTVAVPTS